VASAEWMRAARDLGQVLRNDREPLTVLVGAGSSLSSGAPSTPAATDALEHSTTRFPAGALPDLAHTMDDRDKSASLMPLFGQVVPSVGYRCLAALGRDRRVTVLDLNWEGAAEAAAEKIHVPCQAYDVTLGLPPVPSTGVMVPHLHGTLKKPKVGRGETLGFKPEIVKHLSELHSSGRLVIVGATVEHDHDIRQLLADVHGQRPGVWGFLRASDTSTALRRRNALPGIDPQITVDPDLDFDRLMMLLVDQAISPNWASHQERFSHLDLPDLEAVVLPKREILVGALEAPVAVLVGDPQLGKTTLAHLLGHLHSVWRGGEVRAVAGAQASIAAVAVPDGSSARDAIIIESPFGEAPDTTPNPAFLDELPSWTELGADRARVLVASRVGDWQEPHGWDGGGTFRASPDPGDWYDERSLRLFAKTFDDQGRSVVEQVQPGLLDTPGRIRDQARGIPVEADRPGAPMSRAESTDATRSRLLADNPKLGLLCGLARLQDFGGGVVDRGVLERIADFKRGDSTASRAMLRVYKWEGRECLRLSSAADRVAADGWVSAHAKEVASAVSGPSATPTLMYGWTASQVVHQARAGGVAHGSLSEVAEYGGLLLDAAPTEATLTLLTKVPLTSWSAAETAYSLVRLWSMLPEEPRRRLLKRLLEDGGALGTYGVLEACLYLRGAVDEEVWGMTQGPLWELLQRSDAWEAALALDGLAWRGTSRPIPDWPIKAASKLPYGALRVINAYHPAGIAALGLAEQAQQMRLKPWSHDDVEIAARLVRWHFLHQSRARAQLSRQHWIDKEYLCRTLHPKLDVLDAGASDDLVGGLVNGGEPGWAFHAACFLMGGLDRPIGAGALHELKDALGTAPERDLGIITAAATYEVASGRDFASPLRDYFDREPNVNLFLDAVSASVELDGTHAGLPSFQFALPPNVLHQRLNLRFRRLDRLGYSAQDPAARSAAVVREIRELRAGNLIDLAKEGCLIRLVESGDLRPFEHAAAAFDAAPADLREIVLRAAELLMWPQP